jgi:hypothetical protein
MKNNVKFIYVAFAALIWSDLFNFIFLGTPFAVWKQLIVAVLWFLAIRIDLQGHIFLRSIAAVILTLALVVWSILVCDVPLEIAVFNSFLYFSWVPFFIVFCNRKFDFGDLQYYAVILFFASIVGLYVDWQTDYFNWIEKQVSSVSLLESINAARRASFFFIASTMVVPLLSIPGLIFFFAKPTSFRASLFSTGLLLAVVPTGSGSSMVVALLCCIGVFVSLGIKMLLRAVVIGTVIAFFVLMTAGSMLSDNRTLLQFERLTTAFDLETESNVGRVDYWEIALNDISLMSGGELVLGTGLGSTNDNKGNIAKYFHGESSYFQAMIEAGFLGVLSRLFPFVLVFVFAANRRQLVVGNNYSIVPVVVFWSLASLFAVATAPTFGNIPFQASLGFMLAMIFISTSAKK